MHVDQRLIHNIQNENIMLRQENGRLNGVAKTLDEKYQKSLKQMSSIILANQNLKKQLDNLKAGVKDQIENAIKQMRTSYEHKLEQMVVEKNQIYINNQNLLREKQQLQRDYSVMERKIWETQSLKTEITNLKKQNEKLLLQTHPLTQNKDNPQQKAVEQKLQKKIDDLNLKIIELNVENTQNKKYAESIEAEKANLITEVNSLNKKINQLSSALDKSQHQNAKDENLESENKSLHTKKLQMQVMDLRKKNAELVNEVEKLKLERLEMTSEINKNQAQIQLLNTLKTLHSQLEPMRYQIEQLKRDKYFDRENTNKEKAELHLKLLSNQNELEILKQLIKDMESRNKQQAQQLRQKQWEKSKYQQMQEQKRILEGRVIVYEAMEMVTKNRDKPHHVERLQEFERRIQLLLEQQNLEYLVNNANVHQLIAMKAYIIELDNKLQVVGEQSEHFHKKYGQYKDKYKLLLEDNKQILNKHYATINAYKGKISGYEKLVIKLTAELEKYIKDSQGPSDIESHYNSVITLYESKITSIYNQVNARKQENRDLLKRYDNLQLQHKGKLALIREIQTEVSKLKVQNKQLQNKIITQSLDEGPRNSLSSIPEDHYKSIISQKTKYILQLEQNLSKYKFKIDKMQFDHDRDLDDYKHKINRLEMQVEHLRLEQESANKQLSTAKHSEEFGQLVYKLSSLQKNVAAISQSQVSSHQPRESSGDLERQIQSLRYENKHLVGQLETMRNQFRNRAIEQKNALVLKHLSNQDELSRFRDNAQKTILELHNRISQLEAQLKIKLKQSEIKDRQIDRLSLNHDKTVVLQAPRANNDQLQEQNSRLRAELEKIKANYGNMTLEAESLMNKIRETEAYINDLKDQFSRVCNKMNQYERQLNVKDQKLHEWSQKFKNLQQKYQNQITNAKVSTSKYNEKEIEERVRKIGEHELQIERAFRQIDSKLRDIERRQMEANRRESQIDMKNKDLKDRIRKLEDRERVVTDEQNRLIKLSQDLELRQRRIQTTVIQPPTTFSPQTPQHSYKEEYHELERKMKRMEIQLSQKIKFIQVKDDKMDKLIKEKAELNQALNDFKNKLEQKIRASQPNERQVVSLKNQIQRLQGQLDKLWKQFDMLKQQLRNKQRQAGDLNIEKDELRKKFEIEIRQLNYKIKQLQNIKQNQVPLPRQSYQNINLNEIEKQFQDRMREMEEKHKQKIRELYKQNQNNTNELQQVITDLTLEINKLKSQAQGPSQNNSQIQAHTLTIQSLQSHIKTLEEEVRRKQDIIKQLQQDLFYYQNIVGQRQEELQKLYESSLVPTSHGDSDNADKLRLQNQIISLQMMLQSKHNESINNHDDCIKKEHLLRMQIERISGILQSKITDQASQKPQSPRSQYLDNSYLNQLEETNKNLQLDIALLKQRLVANFDNSRSIDEFLTILVLTFAEVDALRQRLYEMEQNFKQEHERQLNVIKQIDDLKEYEVNRQKIESILKELEIAHKAFHEQESRSKTAFIKRINTEVMVLPGSQAMSISDEISRTKPQEQSIIHHITEEVSSNRLGSLDIPKFSQEPHKLIDYGERSIKNSLMEDSTIQQPLTISNQFSFQPVTFSNPSASLNTGFRTEFPTQFTAVTSNYNFEPPGPRNINFGGPNQAVPQVSFNTGAGSSQFSSFTPYPQINRPTTFSSLNQPVSNIVVPPRITEQFSPNKRFQATQPYQFYQYSEGSQSSVRFPSETNLTSPPSVNFRSSETHVMPYIVSNNQLMR